LFEGEPLNPSHIYQMGYLPEERGLYKKMTVKDQLLYFAELKGLSNKQAKEKLKYWVDKFDIRSWLNKKVEELSKGMQQKIQFIATVIHEPKLLILDEPFSGFDPINAQLLVDEILLLKSKGTSIIFSTHRMDSVELLCDHIALINQSEKILDGNVRELQQAFKKNLFEVKYTGQTLLNTDWMQVIETKEKDGYTSQLIHIGLHLNPNQFLQQLLQEPIGIVSFQEKLPSMEDIFISAVQQKNLNK
jgi:ABC-2 type transport system ATP-binding protein